MLYDEEGRAYVERPILPEDINIFWIVADYRRMYNQQTKMERKIQNLVESYRQMAHYNFFLRGKFQELLAVTKNMEKRMKKQGLHINGNELMLISDAECIAYPKKKK